MNRPLYKDIVPVKSEESNAGLWYDKFCDQWHVDRKLIWTLGAKDNANPKLKWIKEITTNKVGDSHLLKEACGRQEDLLASKSAPAPLIIKTQWHFVSGLGRQHPIENGFTWHHSLGVPYLPGSSVKGMVRNWASQWKGAGPEDIDRIFGPRDLKNTETPAVGSVIFLDALPIEPVLLKADVMTPHYSEYYTEGKPPADWISPVPIPFLVVAKDQSFQFALLPRHQNKQNKHDVHRALAWLQQALENIGAGAKNAAGYGRMEENAILKREREAVVKEAEIAQKEIEWKKRLVKEAEDIGFFGLDQDIYCRSKEGKWEIDKAGFQRSMTELLLRVEAEPNLDVQKNCLIQLVSAIDKHDSGILKNPDKRNEKKKIDKKTGEKPYVYKAKPRELAKELLATIKKMNLMLDDIKVR